MSKTATQVIEDAIFSSLCDAIAAMKQSSGGMPNAMIRDMNSIHANTTLDSLPVPVQQALKKSVQDTLKRLQREGYTVASKSAPAASYGASRGPVRNDRRAKSQ